MVAANLVKESVLCGFVVVVEEPCLRAAACGGATTEVAAGAGEPRVVEDLVVYGSGSGCEVY